MMLIPALGRFQSSYVRGRDILQLKENLKDRTIPKEKRTKLIELLQKGPKGPVEVWWLTSDADSYPLALQIKELLETTGWPNVSERMALGGVGSGFFLEIRDFKTPPAHDEVLARALELAGYPINPLIQQNPEVPIGTVRILIGHKPPVQ